MANTSSEKKSVRVLEKRRTVNRDRYGRIRTFIKNIESAIESNDYDKASEKFKLAQPVIQSAKNKGLMSMAKISRTIKRLNSRIKLLNNKK